MKKNNLLPLLLIISLVFTISCKRDHFITDSGYRKTVEERFNITRELAKNRSQQLFKVFDGNLSLKEREALKFLYAFMPLSDLADYDGSYFLKNMRSSFAARDTFSWGKNVPETVFRHFVLPIRVNNENLDTSRWMFFDELKDRIKGLSMKEAALEVNHWCHEKVTYKGSDSRTSSPLASVKTAYGRCGEESTFTVAALRAVCIPARQCYTPRWAHSDDNHAWVEVWIDGKWHYLGACEPEPDLDMAWFTGPAKRAMLVNTNVFGEYEGSEDVLTRDPRFTKINVLSNYTDTKRIFARILDRDNKPVDSAAVEFQLYNYAEFFPLTKAFTGSNGLCSFLTGFGDLLVWASKNGDFGYRKVTVKTVDTITIVLGIKPGKEYSEDLDFVPPPEIRTESTVSDSLKKKNERRIAFEDKVRADYEATFIDSAKTYRLSDNLKVNADTLWMILKKTRGNWREIIDFITSAPEEQRKWVFPLLLNISDKDLRDVTPEVLADNIRDAGETAKRIADPRVFIKYVLSPRVDYEFLKPYKALFIESFSKDQIDSMRKDPQLAIRWITDNIKIDKNANWARTTLTPVGVFELRVADPRSRDIFFVALCRSFGIPARLEPATLTPQYMKNAAWVDWYPEPLPQKSIERGTLVLENEWQNDRKPEYYIHFTVEKFKDGFPRSLDYETDPVMSTFPAAIQLIPGSYLLVTGNRIAGGTVLAKLAFFDINAGRQVPMTITMRKDAVSSEILGRIELKAFLKEIGGDCTSGFSPAKGTIIAWLDPLREPSRHFIADLALKKEEFSKWGGNILLLFRNEKDKADFISKNRASMPTGITCCVSGEQLISSFLKGVTKQVERQFPVVSYINQGNEILYLSSGYRIGTGDELLRLINAGERQ